jgi:hypothetical protein
MRDYLNAQDITGDAVIQGKREAGQNELPKILIGRNPNRRLVKQEVCCAANLRLKSLA